MIVYTLVTETKQQGHEFDELRGVFATRKLAEEFRDKWQFIYNDLQHSHDIMDWEVDEGDESEGPQET